MQPNLAFYSTFLLTVSLLAAWVLAPEASPLVKGARLLGGDAWPPAYHAATHCKEAFAA